MSVSGVQHNNSVEADRFYEDQHPRELTPKKDVLFTIGDWNANVGSQEIPRIKGKFGPGVQKETGQRHSASRGPSPGLATGLPGTVSTSLTPASCRVHKRAHLSLILVVKTVLPHPLYQPSFSLPPSQGASDGK